MKYCLFFIGLVAPAVVMAATTYSLHSSNVEYKVVHPVHTVIGKTNQSRGKTECDDKGACNSLVAVPAKTFDSGSGNRDQHTLDVIHASTNPMVSVRSRFSQPQTDGPQNLDLEVNFAGGSHIYKQVPVEFKKLEKGWATKGRFSMKFGDFKLERPALLAVPVRDKIEIHFDQIWN